MTHDELKKLKESYNYHRDRSHWEIEELFEYTESLINELAAEVELRESLEESLSEAQEELLNLHTEIDVYEKDFG